MSYPYRVPTPASRQPRPTAAVLGAGIAGLTAAHELAERGFEVTVYEQRVDERAELGGAVPGGFPPVKLGGLAASQFSTPGPTGGSPAQLRPFPGRRGRPQPPRRAVAGEHGFRFFPAYYLHIWDLLQRIPVYEAAEIEDRMLWQPTSRTVMDNVRRVITQATTVDGKPALVFPREEPRSLGETISVWNQLGEFGYTPGDVQTFSGRMMRYLVTSPLRRAAELQNISAYDFIVGKDATADRRFSYTPKFEALILDMPKVLAAFDSKWGDARTNLTTFLQLQLQMDRHDSKADGVLNGPTTESWFDHWYRHLIMLGVRFVRAAVDHLEPPAADREQAPHLRPRVQVVLTDGTRLAPDYVVAAVDAVAAERITGVLRAAGTGGAAAGLDGFTTSVPPPDGPLHPQQNRSAARRDPYAMAEMGRRPWDRFQTLAGVQFYFDTEFQLVRGHVYYSGTEWGLSSINQQGLWERRPTLARDGFVAVLSVDVGDFNTPSEHLLDEHGRGKAARDCTADEIAAEVWRQIVEGITGDIDNVPEALIPWPVWYAIDRNLVMADGPGQGEGPPLRNEAPYLVPIIGDWPNRPGGEPWNPNGTSWITRPTERQWLSDLEDRAVWQARHGGYQVHHNCVVFAGTWTRTFTRMTSMEAACESARHAVNAILDHYVWVETGGADRRETTALDWRIPFGFLDQGFSSPVRLPSPAGDYCFVFDIENREPLDALPLRNLDSQCFRASLPHPLDTAGPGPFGVSGVTVPPIAGGSPMTTPPNDYTGQLLTYLQAWRQYLEHTTRAATPGQPWPAGPAAPTTPPWPAPPPSPTPPTAPGPPFPAAPGLVTPWPAPATPPPAAPVPPRPSTGPRADRPAEPARGDRGRPARDPVRGSLYSAELASPPTGTVADRQPGSAFGRTGTSGGAGSPAPPARRSLYSVSGNDRTPPAASSPPDQLRGVEEVELIGSDPRV